MITQKVRVPSLQQGTLYIMRSWTKPKETYSTVKFLGFHDGTELHAKAQRKLKDMLTNDIYKFSDMEGNEFGGVMEEAALIHSTLKVRVTFGLVPATVAAVTGDAADGVMEVPTDTVVEAIEAVAEAEQLEEPSETTAIEPQDGGEGSEPEAEEQTGTAPETETETAPEAEAAPEAEPENLGVDMVPEAEGTASLVETETAPETTIEAVEEEPSEEHTETEDNSVYSVPDAAAEPDPTATEAEHAVDEDSSASDAEEAEGEDSEGDEPHTLAEIAAGPVGETSKQRKNRLRREKRQAAHA